MRDLDLPGTRSRRPIGYRDQLLRHLAEYRSATLGVAKPGTFRGMEREHILPIEHRCLNLLPGARELVRQYLAEHAELVLHKEFHHLNSSQAFAFNLFFPYLDRKSTR